MLYLQQNAIILFPTLERVPHRLRKKTMKNTFEKWLNHLETYSQSNVVADENRERSTRRKHRKLNTLLHKLP